MSTHAYPYCRSMLRVTAICVQRRVVPVVVIVGLAIAPTASMLLVSGPQATGRSALVENLLAKNPEGKLRKLPAVTTRPRKVNYYIPSLHDTPHVLRTKFTPCPAWGLCFCVTRVQDSEVDGTDYIFVDRLSFEQQIRNSEFLWHTEGTEETKELYGYRLKDIEDIGAQGQVCVLDANVRVADKITLGLDDRQDIEITGVWVSCGIELPNPAGHPRLLCMSVIRSCLRCVGLCVPQVSLDSKEAFAERLQAQGVQGSDMRSEYKKVRHTVWGRNHRRDVPSQLKTLAPLMAGVVQCPLTYACTRRWNAGDQGHRVGHCQSVI